MQLWLATSHRFEKETNQLTLGAGFYANHLCTIVVKTHDEIPLIEGDRMSHQLSLGVIV